MKLARFSDIDSCLVSRKEVSQTATKKLSALRIAMPTVTNAPSIDISHLVFWNKKQEQFSRPDPFLRSKNSAFVRSCFRVVTNTLHSRGVEIRDSESEIGSDIATATAVPPSATTRVVVTNGISDSKSDSNTYIDYPFARRSCIVIIFLCVEPPNNRNHITEYLRSRSES